MIKSYFTVDYDFQKVVDLSKVTSYDFTCDRVEKKSFKVVVVDSVKDYSDLLHTLFDFNLIKALIARKDFKLVFDGMHGVAGPYAKAILGE